MRPLSTDSERISRMLFGSRKNIQVFIERLGMDADLSLVSSTISLISEIRALDRRVRIEVPFGGRDRATELRSIAWMANILLRGTTILNERLFRRALGDPGLEIERMRLFVAEMDSHLTVAVGGA